MNESERGQVTRNAAEVYQEFFVPALFEQWAGRVAHAAQLQPGQRVLDVACGTGVLAREAARRVGSAGSVTGIDINDGMLAVAQRTAPKIAWKHGAAEQLPFETGSFDAVVSQFGLMFFDDRHAALGQMARVLRPRGCMAVAVWASLDETPGYAAMTALLRRLFGEAAANALRAPYALGDPTTLAPLLSDIGVTDVRIDTVAGEARFPSLDGWVHTDVKGWTLADMIDDAQYALLQREAKTALGEFVRPDGTVAFSAPAQIVTAVRS